ncbi:MULTISPECIES: GtrA family protein [Ramlibacter]|uniref:GtrA family protein n=1 Tax=Ramlibacter aquaticus TaxID=2780094 RepID=A0ABR9SG69_9BURK|nr:MULTISPECIES: GtrA family protein [Ramlibacter]MBE7941047.1 GtrA family protein [Ramlibacter aquaticus]
MTRRLAWFVAVGCAAAATHFLVVLALVSLLGAAPLAANVLGWLVAFTVSFAGHWNLTFRASGAPLAQAAGRFFLVSAAGFGANELAYALLLRLGGLRYDVALALVLVGVAVMTWLLSSRWAFRGRRA